MTEAATEEEQKFFRWIAEECNETALEEFLSSKTEDEKKHYFGLVNYNGIEFHNNTLSNAQGFHP